MATTTNGARARVTGLLVRRGPMSRADLARHAALAPSTVSAIVGELQEDGLVVDLTEGPREPALGRPAVRVALGRRAGLALGIDFGKRHVRVALSDLAHTVLDEQHRELDADLPAAEAIALAVTLVDDALTAAGATRAQLVGAGMGLPGPVHAPTGELGEATILPGWVGVRAADAMQAALDVPVTVGNDANLGALSERMWGAGRGVDDLVYLKVATGIGAGMIIAGRPYTGTGGTAGEIGHTIIDPGGSICRCGNRGCLETIAGAEAILHALREVRGDDLSIGEVVARAREGDAGCRRAIADAGQAIGQASATLVNLVNPARIIVGGDIGAAGEVLLEPLRQSLTRGAIRSAADDVTIVESELGDRAQVLGAVALVLERGATLAG